MQIDLAGRFAVVTGSTEGIGYAVAVGLARAGARVVVNGRTESRVAAAVERLKKVVAGADVTGVVADVGSAAGCATLVAAVRHVDILISNAGIFQPGDFFETDDAMWDRHWQVNVMGGVRLARALAPAMVDAGWGRIIFVSSDSAFSVPVEMIHYGVSKTADVALARGLAKRLAGTGVTVNSVLPGLTMSEGVASVFEQMAGDRSPEQAAADFLSASRPSSILRRAASVEEVANMVVYAASPQASATTGAALRVDGGVVDTL